MYSLFLQIPDKSTILNKSTPLYLKATLHSKQKLPPDPVTEGNLRKEAQPPGSLMVIHISYTFGAQSHLSFSPTSSTEMCVHKLHVCVHVHRRPLAGVAMMLWKSDPNMMKQPQQEGFTAGARTLLRSLCILTMSLELPKIRSPVGSWS